MAGQEIEKPNRRDLLGLAAAGGAGLAALLAGCQPPETGGGSGGGGSGGRRRLRAGFSNAGLRGTWNKSGYDAAMLWGNLLDVEVVFFDGEFNGQKQRERIDNMSREDWDFCAIQAHQIDILAEPVRRLAKRGIPVIGMDTLIVEKAKLFETGIPVQIAPDHVAMAEAVTQYMMDRIGGKGWVIHIGGESEHSGARGRDLGFRNVIAKYPEVKVVGGGVRWCDWQTEKARNTFDLLLDQAPDRVAGLFAHNDDMALACYPRLAGTKHEGMVLVGVDGQATGLRGVKEGKLAATSVNPACMIHAWSLIVGQFIVRNGEKFDKLLDISVPSPLVSKESGNLDAMFYLSDPKHGMV